MSNVPSIYEHLTDSDSVNEALRGHGVVEVAEERSQFEPVKCGYCGGENPSISKFCSFCGVALDEKEAERLIEREKAFEKLAGSRGALENILKRVEELEKRLGKKDGS